MRVFFRRWPLWRIVALTLGAIVVSSMAHGDEITDARRAFVSGMKHFDLGEYGQALADFKNGYRAKEDPVFLYNIAQCYRMLKENPDAIRYYRLYLSRAPDASNRNEIEERIAKLQGAIDAEARTPAMPPPSTKTAAEAAPVPGTSAMVARTATPNDHKTPVYKKWWLWTIVGAVAVGAGVGLGLGLTHGSSTSGTTFPAAGF